MSTHGPVRAVVFDVGETLVDEERCWRELAAALGLRPHVVWAALGVTIERGEDHRDLWRHLGLEFPAVSDEILYHHDDLYPDAVACLSACREAGLVVGVAGNQNYVLEEWVRAERWPVDAVGSSASFGVRKPESGFFTRVVEMTGFPAREVAYVGDRVDFDVRPARAAGLVAIHLRRGPWGYLQDAADVAHLVLEDLTELPGALDRLA